MGILTVRGGRDSLSYRTLNKMLRFLLSEKFFGYNHLRATDAVIVFVYASDFVCVDLFG